MPLFEMPADALDKVYARSVFELAEYRGGEGEVKRLAGELDELVLLARSDERFGEFLSSV
ncbi:MAG: hypothetical protein HC915_13355 [Anaerolineae bacterium]|nr:hypothetical protein [Anaerolineae bacterium]